MIAGDGDLDGSLDVLLAADIGEIDVVTLVAGEELADVLPRGGQRARAGEELIDFAQIADAIDIDAGDHRGFARVFPGGR